jgi:hypothetical protein
VLELVRLIRRSVNGDVPRATNQRSTWPSLVTRGEVVVSTRLPNALPEIDGDAAVAPNFHEPDHERLRFSAVRSIAIATHRPAILIGRRRPSASAPSRSRSSTMGRACPVDPRSDLQSVLHDETTRVGSPRHRASSCPTGGRPPGRTHGTSCITLPVEALGEDLGSPEAA